MDQQLSVILKKKWIDKANNQEIEYQLMSATLKVNLASNQVLIQVGMKSSKVSIADVRYRPKKIMNIIERLKTYGDRLIMPTYNKLVRDRIPEIIEKEGKTYKMVILNDDQFKSELQEKLKEEVKEYLNAQSDQEAVEELADALEVIYSLAEAHGVSFEELEHVRKTKAKERG